MLIESEPVASAQALERRYAAKGLVLLPNGLLILAAGKRGKFNLFGGGIKEPETPWQAFVREIGHEGGIKEESLRGTRELEKVDGEITTSRGIRMVADWTLYMTMYHGPQDQVRPGHEITATAFMRPEAALESDRVLDLAKKAIRNNLVDINTFVHQR